MMHQHDDDGVALRAWSALLSELAVSATVLSNFFTYIVYVTPLSTKLIGNSPLALTPTACCAPSMFGAAAPAAPSA